MTPDARPLEAWREDRYRRFVPRPSTDPVLMVHPGEDRWTPLQLSRPFLERVAAPTELVVLEGCGHFPVEEPGFSQMLSAVDRWCARLR